MYASPDARKVGNAAGRAVREDKRSRFEQNALLRPVFGDLFSRLEDVRAFRGGGVGYFEPRNVAAHEVRNGAWRGSAPNYAEIIERVDCPPLGHAVGDGRVFVASEAKADEPFLIQQARRLL